MPLRNHRHPAPLWLRTLHLVLLAFIPLPEDALAQPPDSTRSMYGVPQDEFLRAAWIDARPHTRSTDASGVTTERTHANGAWMTLWQFADSLGVNTIRYKADNGKDSLDDLVSQMGPDHRLIVHGLGMQLPGVIPGDVNFNYADIGFSQQAVFFPFDSMRFSDWPNRFTTLTDSGRLKNNSFQRNEFNGPAGELELAIEHGNVSDELIASGITFAQRPWQTYRFKDDGVTVAPHDSVVQNADWLFRYRRPQLGALRQWHINVRGHLLDTVAPAGDDDALLRVELWHEVPPGMSYWDASTSTVVTPTTLVTRQLASFDVRRRDLAPRDPDVPIWDEYVDTSYAFTIDDHFAAGGNASQRIDIRVYWTGAERVALRSIALRDDVSELMLGKTQRSVAFRDSLTADIKRVFYGKHNDGRNLTQLRADFREQVIGIGSAGEHYWSELDGYKAINYFVKRMIDSIQYGGPSEDSLWKRPPAYSEDGEQALLHHIDPHAEIFTQELEVQAKAGSEYLGKMFGGVRGNLPVLREHNGGRFGLKVPRTGVDSTARAPLPELELFVNDMARSRDSIEAFERSVQRIAFGGQYAPRSDSLHPDPLVPRSNSIYPGGRSQLVALGRMAEDAREQRKRLILVLFNTSRVMLSPYLDSATMAYSLDTTIDRFPEATELIALANLGICYGAKGIVHQVANSNTNILSFHGASGLYTCYDDSWGVAGPGALDTRQDMMHRLGLTEPNPNNANGYGGTERHHIDSIYVGWRNRSDATREINARLKELGPTLMRLRWRDAYSIHFTVPQTYRIRREIDSLGTTVVHYDSLPHRPIASTEIVQQVSARSLRAGAELDPPHETYVELGLFDKKNESNDALSTPITSIS